MVLIEDIVTPALAAVYMTIYQEDKLRQMLKGKYKLKDLCAVMNLKQAPLVGLVKQETRSINKNLV